jgi:hypothetical protein
LYSPTLITAALSGTTVEWGQDRLQKFQNPAARVISGATYDVRLVDLLESLGWKHLELRRNYLKSVFMHTILNNHTAPTLRTSFRLNNECDNTYDLRNRETDLPLPKPNTDSGKGCFKYNGAVVWNNLPYEVKIAESLSSFQGTINLANTTILVRPVASGKHVILLSLSLYF